MVSSIDDPTFPDLFTDNSACNFFPSFSNYS